MVFVKILDFVPAKCIFKFQLLSKFIYNEIIPKYCVNWIQRSSTFSKLHIPELKSKAAILLFQDDLPGSFYSLDSDKLRWKKN